MILRPFQLARISGIPLMIDYTWPLVFGLHFWLVAAFYLPLRSPYLEVWEQVFFGLVMTALFFASIVLHELAHAFAAKVEGIRTLEIRLHVFGGWARLERESPTPMTDLRIALAGPAMSFLIGVFFVLCLLATNSQAMRYSPWRATFWYLAIGNLGLAVFNLIPGLPLDGGRALRAWLWHRSSDILAATRTATRLGVALSYMLISYGLFHAVWRRDFFSAVWIIIIGVFLKQAAEGIYRQQQAVTNFRSAATKSSASAAASAVSSAAPGTVGAVMHTPPVTVAPDLSVSEFIERVLDRHRQTGFPVARDGRLYGVLSLEKLKELPREAWARTTVGEVMLPVDDSLFVTARASVEHAAVKLRASRLSHLAVIDGDGLLVGHLSDADLKRAAKS
jgi:Zn-dependent protease/CBS domain-containing protein